MSDKKQKNSNLSVRKVTGDFLYNIAASVVSAGVLQGLVYPMLALTFDSALYGSILTSMGFINTVSVSLGNTLNNTRLIQQNKYENEKVQGDFNILLSIVNIIGFVSIFTIADLMFQFSLTIKVLMGAEVILLTVRAYFLVAYRIKLNYKKNLVCNIVIAGGYILGLGINYFLSIWPVVFICGELFGNLYLFSTSELHKEPLKITPIFKGTVGKYVVLILTSLSGNLLLYLDRMLLYPLLGGEAVSIYTVAAFLGKTLGIVMTPVAGVLLSYYAQKNFQMNQKVFWKINSLTFLVAAVFLICIIPIGPFFTGIFYPTLIEAAKPYLLLANLAATISVVANMIQPSIIKFVPIYWQIIKEAIYGIAYVGLSLLLFKNHGIYGFCVAAIIANALKLAVLCLIGTAYFMKEKNNPELF